MRALFIGFRIGGLQTQLSRAIKGPASNAAPGAGSRRFIIPMLISNMGLPVLVSRYQGLRAQFRTFLGPRHQPITRRPTLAATIRHG